MQFANAKFKTLVNASLLLLVASLLAPTQGFADQLGLGVEQLELSGLTLVQSSAQLQEKLGAPVASHRTTDQHTGEPATVQIYQGVTAYLVAGEAMRLKTTDPAVATPAGAKVGDSVEQILGIYSPVAPRVRERDRLELQVQDSQASLVFHTYRNRVTAIELRLDYL